MKIPSMRLKTLLMASMLVMASTMYSQASLVPYQWAGSGYKGSLMYNTDTKMVSNYSFGSTGNVQSYTANTGNTWDMVSGYNTIIPSSFDVWQQPPSNNYAAFFSSIANSATGELNADFYLNGNVIDSTVGYWKAASVPEPPTYWSASLICLPLVVTFLRRRKRIAA